MAVVCGLGGGVPCRLLVIISLLCHPIRGECYMTSPDRMAKENRGKTQQ